MCMHLCSATSAMWCALHAMTSLGCQEAAMCAAPRPQGATNGATPWNRWWTPSVFRVCTLPMAARRGQYITTVKATPRHARMHHATALAWPAALLAPQQLYCIILPTCTDGPAQLRIRLVLASTLNLLMASISSPLPVLVQTKAPQISTCSC